MNDDNRFVVFNTPTFMCRYDENVVRIVYKGVIKEGDELVIQGKDCIVVAVMEEHLSKGDFDGTRIPMSYKIMYKFKQA